MPPALVLLSLYPRPCIKLVERARGAREHPRPQFQVALGLNAIEVFNGKFPKTWPMAQTDARKWGAGVKPPASHLCKYVAGESAPRLPGARLQAHSAPARMTLRLPVGLRS